MSRSVAFDNILLHCVMVVVKVGVILYFWNFSVINRILFWMLCTVLCESVYGGDVKSSLRLCVRVHRCADKSGIEFQKIHLQVMKLAQFANIPHPIQFDFRLSNQHPNRSTIFICYLVWMLAFKQSVAFKCVWRLLFKFIQVGTKHFHLHRNNNVNNWLFKLMILFLLPNEKLMRFFFFKKWISTFFL